MYAHRLSFLAALLCLCTVGRMHSQDLQTRHLKLIHPNGSNTILQGQSDSGSVTITLPSRSGRLSVEGAGGGGSDSTSTGMISLFAALPLPTGYLECNGATVSRTLYPQLFGLIGETYGPGDGSTTFQIPTLQSPVSQFRTDLVGDWKFSNNVDDSSGQGHPAVLLNGAQYAVDRNAVANYAVALDGINDQVKINAPFFDIGWQQYTLSVWVNFAVLAQVTYFGVINTYPHTGLALVAGGRGNTKYRLWVGSGPPAGWNVMADVQSIHDYAVGQWQHLALVRDGMQIRLFIDGVLDNTFGMAAVPPSVQCTMTLGSCSDNICGYWLNGSIDDFTVWKRALSADEISKIFAGTTPSNAPRYVIRAR